MSISCKTHCDIKGTTVPVTTLSCQLPRASKVEYFISCLWITAAHKDIFHGAPTNRRMTCCGSMGVLPCNKTLWHLISVSHSQDAVACAVTHYTAALIHISTMWILLWFAWSYASVKLSAVRSQHCLWQNGYLCENLSSSLLRNRCVEVIYLLNTFPRSFLLVATMSQFVFFVCNSL